MYIVAASRALTHPLIRGTEPVDGDRRRRIDRQGALGMRPLLPGCCDRGALGRPRSSRRPTSESRQRRPSRSARPACVCGPRADIERARAEPPRSCGALAATCSAAANASPRRPRNRSAVARSSCGHTPVGCTARACSAAVRASSLRPRLSRTKARCDRSEGSPGRLASSRSISARAASHCCASVRAVMRRRSVWFTGGGQGRRRARRRRRPGWRSRRRCGRDRTSCPSMPASAYAPSGGERR